MGEYYGALNIDTYNDFIDSIEFRDPSYITKIITKKGTQSDDPTAAGFGLLGLPEDIQMFDMGHGTGKMGRLLYNKGYENIEGADATPEFVKYISE